MSVKELPPAELTASAIQLLCRELGPVNTARFIQQFTIGYGNYTEERADLLDELTVDDIVSQIERRRHGSQSEPEG